MGKEQKSYWQGYRDCLKYMRQRFGGMDYFDRRDRDKVIAIVEEEAESLAQEQQ